MIFVKLINNNSELRIAHEFSLAQCLNESSALKNTCVNCEVYKWKQAEGKITLRITGCKITSRCTGCKITLRCTRCKVFYNCGREC